MLGLGETKKEVLKVLTDLRRVDCDFLTLGQYLAPSPKHLPVQRFVLPEELAKLSKSFIPEAAALNFLEKRKGMLEGVVISGGEPTVARSLPDIIRRARELGYDRLKMMTNGVRFADPKFVDCVAAAGLTNIALSIHGSSAAGYEDVHGKRDDFKRCVQAVGNLRRLAPHISVEVNTVVTRGNVDALADLGRWVEETGLSRLHVQLAVPNSRDGATHFTGHARAAAAFRRLIAERAARLRINFAFIPPCAMSGYENYVPGFDFTSAFFTNRPDLILSWQRSLLAAKRVVAGCADCPRWTDCRGFWTPRN